MAFKSDESIDLFRVLAKRGYSPEFCMLISSQLNASDDAFDDYQVVVEIE